MVPFSVVVLSTAATISLLARCSVATKPQNPTLHMSHVIGGRDDDINLKDLSVTYESCVASLQQMHAQSPAAINSARVSTTSTRLVFQPKTLTNIRWMHVPKAGTSFAATLFAYACNGPEPLVSVAESLSPVMHTSINIGFAFQLGSV